MRKEIGTIICTGHSPCASEFDFVVTDNSSPIPVRKGQFVEVKTEEGIIIGQVTEVVKTNRYFMHADAVREFERSGYLVSSIFPVDRWEYIIGKAIALAVLTKNGIERVTFPPSPGDRVFLADEEVLPKFLGFDMANGVEIGTLMYHDVPVRLDLTRLLQKHVAILAMSGAGKSYLASILMEELLLRRPEQGRIGVIVIDVHGEYVSMAEKCEDSNLIDFSDKISVIDASYFQISVPLLSERDLAEYQPQMTPIQIRELGRIISARRRKMLEKGEPYDLKQIIQDVERDERIQPRTKEALLGWLYDLESTGLFGPTESPILENIIKPGHATIIDLSGIVSLRKKQIIVAYMLRRLFDLRKRNVIPPFLAIIEEAHQFCPEARRELAISKSIIETIAREGRKFFASLCLISQRPVRLSTTALSQCNTHIILRITNPYDLKHIGESCEGIDKSTLDAVTTLNVGEALIVGEATNFPVFVKIRTRKSRELKYSVRLEEVARRFEEFSDRQLSEFYDNSI